jgi:hypothetical protein
VNELLGITERRRETRVPVYDGLDLDYPPLLDLQPHRVVRGCAVFLDGAEPRGVARIHVGDLETGFRHAADRPPQA